MKISNSVGFECPHCGYVDEESYEFRIGHDNHTTIECGECEKEFDVTVKIEYTYISFTGGRE